MLFGGKPPLDLVAVLARRGESDLLALADLIRGKTPDAAQLDTLRRAGLIRPGPHPRVPGPLIAPILALETALGLRGDGPMAQLLALLKGAVAASEREALLVAMAEQLQFHLDELDVITATPAAPGLRELLDDLDATVRRLDADAADPALVTQVADLCARLVERLASRLTPRRKRKPPTPLLPGIDSAQLAGLVADHVVVLPVTVAVPDCGALARALVGGAVLPAVTQRREQLAAASGAANRRLTALQALRANAPLTELYSCADGREALRRHAALIGLGETELDAAGWRSSGQPAPGSGAVAWLTVLSAAAAAGHDRDRKSEPAADVRRAA
jgi:hypothetical protein